jgi:peptide deformylase
MVCSMMLTVATGAGGCAPMRVAVIDVRPEGKPQRLVLINPEVISQDGQQYEEEGCLSIPGVYAKLKRFSVVRIRALDEQGQPWEMSATGLLARAFQHEIDHLDGKLYVDRLPFEERLKVLDVIKDAKSRWN